MRTTKAEIDAWIKEGKRKKASHLIVVCDTFSYEDYPVYAFGSESLSEKRQEYNGRNMQSIMEVIPLAGE